MKQMGDCNIVDYTFFEIIGAKAKEQRAEVQGSRVKLWRILN